MLVVTGVHPVSRWRRTAYADTDTWLDALRIAEEAIRFGWKRVRITEGKG